MEKELENIDSKDSSDIQLPRLHERHVAVFGLDKMIKETVSLGSFYVLL